MCLRLLHMWVCSWVYLGMLGRATYIPGASTPFGIYSRAQHEVDLRPTDAGAGYDSPEDSIHDYLHARIPRVRRVVPGSPLSLASPKGLLTAALSTKKKQGRNAVRKPSPVAAGKDRLNKTTSPSPIPKSPRAKPQKAVGIPGSCMMSRTYTTSTPRLRLPHCLRVCTLPCAALHRIGEFYLLFRSFFNFIFFFGMGTYDVCVM